MSELPDRPDLDQLRRQARELLRAAADGEPHATARLSAVSRQVTLSAAQLALAREYGLPSWPALRVEVERRRRLAEPAAGRPFPERDAAEERWSFSGTGALDTADGVLFPDALVIGPDHAVLYATFAYPGNGEHAATQIRDQVPSFDDITVIDDQGEHYTLQFWGMSGPQQRPGRPTKPAQLNLLLDPLPHHGAEWFELRSQGGAAIRLVPSPRADLRLGRLVPAAVSRAERQLSDLAHFLVSLRLGDDGPIFDDMIGRHCSAALTTAARLRQSGELDAASPLPDQLAQLCAVLTEHRPTVGLPADWASMLDAAQLADGPRRHLEIGVGLPPIDGIAVQVDSLTSWSDGWRLRLRAMPGWWAYSEDSRRKWAPISVHARDELGGSYLNRFGGSSVHRGQEELALAMLPRLNPLAGALKLTFQGTDAEISLDLLDRAGGQPGDEISLEQQEARDHGNADDQ